MNYDKPKYRYRVNMRELEKYCLEEKERERKLIEKINTAIEDKKVISEADDYRDSRKYVWITHYNSIYRHRKR